MKNSIQNPEKGIALYYQVENSIREKIENGEWKVGQKLPTEPELCQFFGVSRTTIRQAVDSLVSAGLLAKKQGSGTYVTQATTARNHLNFQPSNIVCQYFRLFRLSGNHLQLSRSSAAVQSVHFRIPSDLHCCCMQS